MLDFYLWWPAIRASMGRRSDDFRVCVFRVQEVDCVVFGTGRLTLCVLYGRRNFRPIWHASGELLRPRNFATSPDCQRSPVIGGWHDCRRRCEKCKKLFRVPVGDAACLRCSGCRCDARRGISTGRPSVRASSSDAPHVVPDIQLIENAMGAAANYLPVGDTSNVAAPSRARWRLRCTCGAWFTSPRRTLDGKCPICSHVAHTQMERAREVSRPATKQDSGAS